MRAILLSWLAAFILVFGLNGVFHTFVAPGLFDPYLEGIMLPMGQADPLRVALVEAVLVAVTAYFALRTGRRPVRGSEGARAGALVGLVGAWTFNLINSTLVPGWPLVGALVDVGWHVALGAAGGLLLARAYTALAGE